jgi:sulfhydrogenase subunit gamma (sulfur reductase)
VTLYGFHPARVVGIRNDAEGIRTFALRFVDPEIRRSYRFALGQFNMLYAFGIGEVAISIVSDPADPERLEHTVRIVGRVTGVMAQWKVGEVVGVRGPYGRGWPLEAARDRDVVIITGGIGCAPVVGVIDYILRRRDQYGALHVVHGVKKSQDLLFPERYEAWRHAPRTQVYLAADQGDAHWRGHVGVVTGLFDALDVDRSALVMMCGPEVMMRFAVKALHEKGIRDDSIYLSLERNMQCAVGICGHCQLAPHFVCRDGPVFPYSTVRRFFGTLGL